MFWQGLPYQPQDKKDPFSTEAHIVTFFPKKPNNFSKVDIVMTYAFEANGQTWSNKNQTLPSTLSILAITTSAKRFR
ncbi:hypothetical protein EDP2_2622 [Enterobacter cloacae S611]|uniref:Uncharacterized protein n=1 Tax=Enterobacter cloacae S611 TaxID=1399146 RepID=A0ABN0Q6H7_ENTCL|nr:hypothetical protein EDP2_2622 [Enterobacter cloacae S611]